MQTVRAATHPHNQAPRLRNKAQAKHGHDVARSIYYRHDYNQPWQEIARQVSRLKRWARAKRDSYPVAALYYSATA